MEKGKHPYDDIIHLPHHVSHTRPPMPMADRAAQFSPFAALVGYDAAIAETGRYTDARIELGEEELKELDRRFQLLVDQLPARPQVTITCFQADSRKAGGAYREVTGIVKKLDSFRRLLLLEDGQVLSMDDIFSLEGEIFSLLE